VNSIGSPKTLKVKKKGCCTTITISFVIIVGLAYTECGSGRSVWVR